MLNEIQEQQAYYARTADRYDEAHISEVDEHGKALGAFMGIAEALGPVESVLDVGAGTGRAMQRLKARWPSVRVIGVEPVEKLRQIGHQKGIPENELVAGDGLNLANFADNSFDFVIETAVLQDSTCRG